MDFNLVVEKMLNRERMTIVLENLFDEMAKQDLLETFETFEDEGDEVEKNHWRTTAGYFREFLFDLDDKEYEEFLLNLQNFLYENLGDVE